MANTASARKRIRQTAVRTLRNNSRKSRVRTFVKKVELAIATGDKTVAAEALRAAQPEMQRGVTKGVLHLNTVARKIARLAKRIKARLGPNTPRPPPSLDRSGAEGTERVHNRTRGISKIERDLRSS